MAVYNGEEYLREQIDSILQMMTSNDELVISYDESSDSSLSIIREYANKDRRVKIVYDRGHSVESNFNNAVKYCCGKYIFLSDQDDVWINDKINVMCQFFENNPSIKVLISDGYYTNDKLEKQISMYKALPPKKSAFRNWMKGSYLGCQMAFASTIKKIVWPVRVSPPIPHDLWLGVLGSFYGQVGIINDKLILHRLHGDNYSTTSKMKLLPLIKERTLFAYELVKRIKKNKGTIHNHR